MNLSPNNTGQRDTSLVRDAILWTQQEKIGLDVYEDGSLLVTDAAPLVRVGTRRAAPAAFTATFDKATEPVVQLRIEIVEGRFQCTAVQLLGRPGAVISSTSLREVPIGELIKEAVRGAVHVIAFEINDTKTLRRGRRMMRWLWGRKVELKIGDAICAPQLLNADAPKELRTHLLDEAAAIDDRQLISHNARLERVASTYTEAFKSSQPTTAAIQNAENVSKQRAANLIAEARKQGLLPPTSRGKRNA